MDDRFLKFTLSVSRMNKKIQAIKTAGMGKLGLKAAHTTVLYILGRHPEGLRFSEVAERCDLDQALISRTFSELIKAGMVRKEGAEGRYNARYSLTEEGREQTERIVEVIQTLLRHADEGIDPKELVIFYKVLGQLLKNFEEMETDYDTVFAPLHS